MYKTYPYGHDYGHSNTCGVAVIDGQVCMHLMPSALLVGTYEKFVQSIGADSFADVSKLLGGRKHIISFNGESFYVGDLAMQMATSENNDFLMSRYSGRYWSNSSIAMLLATSGTLISDEEYALSVVTNLPVSAHNEENIKKIRDSISGSYNFTLDGRERTAHISIKKTIKEGAGANIAYGSGRSDRTAIVDIGGKTTDLYIVEGHTPIADKCASIDIGVEAAFSKVIKDFSKCFGVPLSGRDAIRLQMCYATSRQYSTVPTVFGFEIDPQQVHFYIEKIVRQTGTNIRDNIKSFWSSALGSDVVLSDVSLVLLVGGGAYYFEQDIRPLFKRRLRRVENAEYANALGYAQLAQHFLQKERTYA